MLNRVKFSVSAIQSKKSTHTLVRSMKNVALSNPRTLRKIKPDEVDLANEINTHTNKHTRTHTHKQTHTNELCVLWNESLALLIHFDCRSWREQNFYDKFN